MDNTNKKLIIAMAVIIVLLINTSILYCIVSLNDYWQDIVIASLIGLNGIILFYPLIDVARKKITFDEYLEDRKHHIAFFCYFFAVLAILTVMYVTMTKMPQLENTFGALSVVFVFIATMFWIKFAGENGKN